MILTVGSTVVYPCQGPCLVGAAVERLVAGEPRSFYQLVALYDSGGQLFAPADKVRAIGIRLPAQRSDIPKLQGHLMETTKVAKDWKQGANDILKTVHLRIGV